MDAKWLAVGLALAFWIQTYIAQKAHSDLAECRQIPMQAEEPN